MSKQGTVWLVGMMGSGKSTLGPRLAKRLGRPFVDTDAAIEARARRSIPEIFEAEGEPGFRRRERDAMAEAASAGAVVALGGGAMVQPGAPDWLAEHGLTIFLRARIDTLLERIGDPGSRPLLAGLDEAARRAKLASLLADRTPHYEKAAMTLDTDADLDLDALVDTLADRIVAAEATES